MIPFGSFQEEYDKEKHYGMPKKLLSKLRDDNEYLFGQQNQENTHV